MPSIWSFYSLDLVIYAVRLVNYALDSVIYAFDLVNHAPPHSQSLYRELPKLEPPGRI